MLVLALAILLQLSLRHHLSAMTCLRQSPSMADLRTIRYFESSASNQARELGSDYAGDRPARTNEINLKGYESALAVGPLACLAHDSPPGPR